MTPSFAGNQGIATAALRGTTLRVQRRPGAPDADDPFESTVVMDPPLDGFADEDYAEADAMALMDAESDPSMTPQMDMMNRDTTNRTAFLENNFPLAAQEEPGDFEQGFDPSMLAAMMGGGGMPGGGYDDSRDAYPGQANGPVDPRRRAKPAIMKGLGF